MSARFAKTDKPKSRFQKLYLAYIARQNKALLRDLLKTKQIHPRLTVGEAFMFLFAGLVHLFSIGLVILGVWLIRWGWPSLVTLVLGLLCFAIAIVLRPRLGTLPKKVLTRKDAPTLYGLVDGVAKSMGIPPIEVIAISEWFNAWFQRVGPRRQSVLTLGLPLWEILDEQAKVALVAHELAHSANHDSARGFFVGSAVTALSEWYFLLKPPTDAFRNS